MGRLAVHRRRLRRGGRDRGPPAHSVGVQHPTVAAVHVHPGWDPAASVGRDFIIPDDLKALAFNVLEHRLILTPDAQMRGVTTAAVVQAVLAGVAVPPVSG